MIELTFCMRRLPHFTQAQFCDYWLNQHASLMKKHRAALGVTRYTQVHRTDSELNAKVAASRGGPEPFDGIALVAYASWAAFEATLKDPAARAAAKELAEDERRFIDVARSPIWINEVHEIY